jgi:hypothetical protein
MLLDRHVHFTEREVAALLNRPMSPAPQVARGEVSLAHYDQLLPNSQASREVAYVVA